MCATVCPSQALAFVTPQEIGRRREKPVNVFHFGSQRVTTKVHLMLPAGEEALSIDVLEYIWEG